MNMKVKLTHIPVSLCCICLLVGPVGAAEKGDQQILDMSLEKLQEVVVTDTKMAQPQATVTQKVEVVDAAEIDQHTTLNRNISELLMYRSGLFVNTLSRNDANWGSFGGLGPKYNGYLLDGLPIDSFVDAMSLDPWIFERVELYKGPASVMYSNYLSMDFAGNETPLAGTTNFVLRDNIESPLTRIRLGGGSYGTLNEKLYHQDAKEDFTYFFGVNYEQSDYTNYGTADSWLNILSDPDYKKVGFYTNLSYHFGRVDHKLALFLNHSGHTGNVGRPNRDFENQYDTINLAYSNQVSEALNVLLKGGYRGYDRRWGNDNYPGDLGLTSHNGVEQRILPVDLSINLKHAGESQLTLGVDGQSASYETYTETAGVKASDNRVSSSSRGAFLQEKLVLDKWVLRTGGRFNYTSHSYETINGVAPTGATEKSWSKPLWSLGARYNASAALAFYGNGGSSFVVPSAKQLWGTTSDPLSPGQLPNPDLNAENGLGSDLGVEWIPMNKLTIGMRGFLNQIDNAIIDNVVSKTTSQTRSENAGKARSYGAEVMADHKMSDDLRWFANLTYTSSKVSNPLDTDNDGTNIPFVPDYLANLGFTAKLPWAVAISPYLHWVGKYYDSTSRAGRSKFGSYAAVNLKLRKFILEKSEYASAIFIDLNNVTDKRSEMPWGFQDPGFNAFAGLEVTMF